MEYLLPDSDRWALVDYVKTFDARFAAPQKPAPMPLPDPPSRSRSVGRGRDVYAKMQCTQCHGENGRRVGPSSATMLSTPRAAT